MFAVWALFDNYDQDYLYQKIQELSRLYESPIFIPHITAYGLVDTSLETIDKIVLDSIKGVLPFNIEKNVINFSDNFWKTLFIEIKPNDYLENINKKLTERLSQFSKYEFLPHVSLIYKEMSQDNKQKLANELDIKNNFRISRMGILQFSEKIENWKIVREYQFGIS